jgi:diphthamide biosynthesis protein 7
VSSSGTISFHRLHPLPGESIPLRHISTQRCPDLAEGALLLSCAWHPTVDALLAVTASDGSVTLLHLDLTTLNITGSWDIPVSNTLEAWFVAISPGERRPEVARGEEPFVVYSGGDDSTLRYTSCLGPVGRGLASGLGALHPTISVKGKHGAGITAILALPVRLQDGFSLVITGSYDDQLRVFAVRAPHNPSETGSYRLLAEHGLGGGVWRLRLLDLRSDQDQDGAWKITLLASCMHAGVRIVEIGISTTSGDCKVSVLAEFEEHKSMNYGSDVVPCSGSKRTDGRVRFVSTSFYDRLLCLWEIERPINQDIRLNHGDIGGLG